MGAVLKLLLVIVVGLWLWYSPALRRLWRPGDKPRPPGANLPERMVRCAHCGIHLPESDAVRSPEGSLYCSASHRSRGTRAEQQDHPQDHHG